MNSRFSVAVARSATPLLRQFGETWTDASGQTEICLIDEDANGRQPWSDETRRGQVRVAQLSWPVSDTAWGGALPQYEDVVTGPDGGRWMVTGQVITADSWSSISIRQTQTTHLGGLR